MNEEWFGICAKGPTNERGLYQLYPRSAYYVLKEIHKFDPYQMGSIKALEQFFSNIEIVDAAPGAR
nr:hypothetical protein [Saprospiraceae bacterium]